LSEKKHITLNLMHSGQSGKVAQILGGQGLINRLSAMGIRPGKQITKTSAMFLHGPVTIQVGQTQAAIGYGMASKIMVEVD
jgi:ferrous iron transport protein A